jgi:sugar-specific transcriptional regulator TrmB
MEDIKIKSFLSSLGLDQFEAQLYLTLIKKGILTTLELARETKIDRSKVYRRLEHLKNLGVIEEVVDENRVCARAVGFDRLEQLVKSKEDEVGEMKKNFQELKLFLSAHVGENDPSTKVLFYRGKEGIRQMVWNVLRAHKEVVGYSYRPISELIGVKFLEKWTREFEQRGLLFRDLYSEEHLKKKELPKAWDFSPKHFNGRFIPSRILDIDHQVDIYNDVVAYYNWYEGEVFGVEIYNKKIARMQKQIFEILWRFGKK